MQREDEDCRWIVLQELGGTWQKGGLKHCITRDLHAIQFVLNKDND